VNKINLPGCCFSYSVVFFLFSLWPIICCYLFPPPLSSFCLPSFLVSRTITDKITFLLLLLLLLFPFLILSLIAFVVMVVVAFPRCQSLRVLLHFHLVYILIIFFLTLSFHLSHLYSPSFPPSLIPPLTTTTQNLSPRETAPGTIFSTQPHPPTPPPIPSPPPSTPP